MLAITATVLVVELVGADRAAELRDASLAIYRRAAAIAEEKGLILADTKFEFGTLPDGSIVLADEVLTPDSSRFWSADTYQEGRVQPSLDKQFVRDYLETLDWNKTAPGPSLPSEVIERTRAKYAEALQKLAGITVD